MIAPTSNSALGLTREEERIEPPEGLIDPLGTTALQIAHAMLGGGDTLYILRNFKITLAQLQTLRASHDFNVMIFDLARSLSDDPMEILQEVTSNLVASAFVSMGQALQFGDFKEQMSAAKLVLQQAKDMGMWDPDKRKSAPSEKNIKDRVERLRVKEQELLKIVEGQDDV